MNGLNAGGALSIAGVPAFRDNRIWVIHTRTEAILVDPGDAAPAADFLQRHGLQLAGILLTHHHADHVGGVAALCQRVPDCPVFGPAAESITGVSQALAGEEVLSLLGHSWRVMAVPGHTRGHLAYYSEAAAGTPCLFCGDVLFGLGCGRLFEGSPEQMAQSLDKILSLPDNTLIYCAHEYTELNVPFARRVMPENTELQQRIRVLEESAEPVSTLPLTLAEEKATNPFLRCTDPTVVAAATRHAGLTGQLNSAEVFAVLRRWRDLF
jgi:hydroxyacylglutathione hydrolase